MKKLYLITIIFLIQINVYSQEYITWNPATSVGGVTGTYSVGIVNTLQTGVGNNISFSSPANPQGNLMVGGANTFSTFGSASNAPSRSLTFNFSTPVIVTRYNMADIDLGSGGWNDTFNFGNITFSNNPAPTNTSCNAILNGAIATGNVGANAEFASWYCSNPLTNFTLNYTNTNGLTHAYLAYSIQILVPPSMGTVCKNSPPPAFPVIGNNIQGTWNPSAINTSNVGVSQYVFTPNVGQPIRCPISMSVVVNDDCCIPNVILASPNNDIAASNQNNREASVSITASNKINSNAIGVYHAGQSVVLTNGFHATNGSRFRGYIEGCTNSFVGKKESDKINVEKDPLSSVKISNDNSGIYPNPCNSILNVSASPNESLKSITINSLDGKMVFRKSALNQITSELDIASLEIGVYLLMIETNDGKIVTKKLIKN